MLCHLCATGKNLGATFLVLTLALALSIGTKAPALAGAAERGAIEKSLKKIGVPEEKRRTLARAIDTAMTGIRRYISSKPPAKGKPITSKPNPLDPLVTIAANLDTITCGTTLAAIRGAQRDLASKLAFESRDATTVEAQYWRDLESMHTSLYLACNPEDRPKQPTNKDEKHTTGNIDIAETSPAWPNDWTHSDISCFQDCFRPHYNYSTIADRTLPGQLKAYRWSVEKVARLMTAMSEHVIAEFSANPLTANSCEIIQQHSPAINSALKKYGELREQAKENLAVLDKIYKDKVIACIKKCPKHVQIKLASGYPETPEHTQFRVELVYEIPFSSYQCEGVTFNLDDQD